MQQGTASDWAFVAAGYSYAMAIKTNGTLWAWGANDVGQLGVGGTDNKFLPVQVGTDNNWATVSCGYQSTVALKTDGSLWAWGNNDYGQLGDGTTTSYAYPTLIPVAGCVLGNEQCETSKIAVSPNPSNSTFKINLATNYQKLAVYDLLGNIVFSKNINNMSDVVVDLSSFASGCYVAKLINDSAVVNLKLLKN